jgi:SSS family solute:Na+ symporter
MWGLLGLIAVALYSGVIDNSDYIWGHATRDLLGPLGIGLVGLMIACLLAALMSTADTLMITASGVLTHNLYVPLVTGKDERHYVKVGRIMGAIVLIGGALLATWFDTILQLLKFIWEFNAILAAGFWCGMKWRRANRTGAWASMAGTALLFALLPIFLPVFAPALRTNTFLLKQTNPAPLVKTYAARKMDVLQREKDIAHWDSLFAEGNGAGERPKPISFGQKISKTIQPPKKSVFWSKGLKMRDGRACGDGLLYVDMLLIDRLCDLSRNPYALNETIRTLLRIIVPFLVLILVSLTTAQDSKARLDRFFVKMRTEVKVNREEDRREMEKSYADVNRFSEKLLFPKSGLEFFKWRKVDGVGFGIAVAGVISLIVLLQILLKVGA